MLRRLWAQKVHIDGLATKTILTVVVSEEREESARLSITLLVEEDAHDQACLVWSGREDLNLRPLRPERSALPGCATPRQDRAVNRTRDCLTREG